MTLPSIETAAARLRWGVLIGWVLLLLAYLAGRFGLAAGSLRFETHASGAGIPGGLALSDLSIILLTIALFRLSQMLSAIAGGETFSADVVRSFRGFAFWLFLLALTWVVGPLAAELLREQSGAERELEFRLQVRDLLTLGITLILFLVARLLERARLIEEDMREIV